jgi:exonuclease SbcD
MTYVINSMRIAHLADIHLGHRHLNQTTPDGQNQRQADFEQAALAVARHLRDEIKPDVVIIAGDLLNETNLSVRALSGAAQFLEILKDQRVIAIGGNHDEAESPGRYNGLTYLSEHNGLELYLDRTHIDIDSARFHLVSYRNLSRAQRKNNILDDFEFNQDKSNILVAHGYAPGNGVPQIPEEMFVPEEWIDDPRFDLVLLGHIHTHAQIRDTKAVFYSGSTERRNFGEARERPGFWLHNIDEGSISSESIYIDQLSDRLPRPMLEAVIDTKGMTAQEVDVCVQKLFDDLDLEGAMLRVLLQNVSAEVDRSRAREVWRRKFRALGGFHFEAVTQTRHIRELLDIEFAAPPIDVAGALREFLDKQQYQDDEEKARIIELADTTYAEAQELTGADS